MSGHQLISTQLDLSSFLQKKLAEMEEKYKKHAIFQTQFENDNQKLLYEVDLLKDMLEEHEELIIELRRQFKEKSRVLERARPSVLLPSLASLNLSLFYRNSITRNVRTRTCRPTLRVSKRSSSNVTLSSRTAVSSSTPTTKRKRK